MSNSFFETQSAHSNIMYWWHGVIVDDSYWAGCSNEDISNENSKLHLAKQLEDNPKKGWGKRYKVAIVGRHYEVKADPNEADLLEMAEVVYPVTAGSGLGGTKQTAALRQGTHVIGFYADGKEGRNPVILGAFGVNEQNEPIIYPGDPPEFFRLRSGTKGACGERLKPVAENLINLAEGKRPIEAIESPIQAAIAHRTQLQDGNRGDEVKKTLGCESPSSIIEQIKSILNQVSYITNLIKSGLSDLTAFGSSIINSLTRQITGLANGLVEKMRGYVINKINNGIKDVMNKLPPFLRPEFNTNSQSALNGLSCAFNNIKNSILNIVKDLIKQFIDNYINAPLCAATSFLSALLGNIIGQVNGVIGTAVGIINNFLNIGTGFGNKALDILDIALDLLKLFECEADSPECPQTDKWSFWKGPNEISSNAPSNVSRRVKTIIDEVGTALPGSAEGAASNPCNSRQVPCGPPTIQITGGGGSGSSANAVVSLTGRILGLDFSSFGSGYTSNPQITVVDSCGTGGGAVIKPVMKPTGDFNEFQEEILELTGVIVEDSGTQYLPAPNGTTGGNGLIFSQPNDTIHFKTGSTQIINGKEVKGTGYDVYKCGTTFSVKIGDEVYLPSGTVGNVYDNNGNLVQVLNGLGQITRLIITADGTITAPCNDDNVPIVPEIESYPIIAEIESVFIKNPGFNYTENDTIRIQGNNGAELDFKVNSRGEVTEVSVVNGGTGFTDVPYIFIDSPTGYNFEAVAVFKFTSLADIDLNNITPPLGAKLISVVDCVGKINE